MGNVTPKRTITSNSFIELKRRRIVNEILTTEASYVNNLQTVTQKFLMPLLAASQTSKPILKVPQIKTIFMNIQVILNYNNLLLGSLEDRIAAWSDKQVLGDIFFKMVRPIYE